MTTTTTTINAATIEALRIQSGKLSKGHRAELSAGTYAIDDTIRVVGSITVKPDTVGATSVAPQMPQLVAVILAKLNSATRNRILRELPAEFAELGKMPDVSADLLGSVEGMLKELRQSKQITRKGPVSGTVELSID